MFHSGISYRLRWVILTKSSTVTRTTIVHSFQLIQMCSSVWTDASPVQHSISFMVLPNYRTNVCESITYLKKNCSIWKTTTGKKALSPHKWGCHFIKTHLKGMKIRQSKNSWRPSGLHSRFCIDSCSRLWHLGICCSSCLARTVFPKGNFL